MGQFEHILENAQGVRGKSGGGAAKLGSAPGGRYPSYAHRSTGIPVLVPEQHSCSGSGSGEHF